MVAKVTRSLHLANYHTNTSVMFNSCYTPRQLITVRRDPACYMYYPCVTPHFCCRETSPSINTVAHTHHGRYHNNTPYRFMWPRPRPGPYDKPADPTQQSIDFPKKFSSRRNLNALLDLSHRDGTQKNTARQW
ncbi:MAG: hypothetical protein J3Q66DRAFT_369401 [Benniella sp.]|nr:MAG: hypothetical protein J3Q66DRAFT_369401 [Benniella sp.]